MMLSMTATETPEKYGRSIDPGAKDVALTNRDRRNLAMLARTYPSIASGDTGHPHGPNNLLPTKDLKMCTFPGCPKPAPTNDYCKTHRVWLEWLKR